MSLAPIEPVHQPDLAGPAVPLRFRHWKETLIALAVLVVVAGIGAPVGLLWSAVAPKVELVQTQIGPYPAEGEPEGFIADEGWFVLIGFALGIVLAVALWMLVRRHRGPLLLVGLVLGSVGGAVIAAWLGHRIGYAEFVRQVRDAPPGTHFARPATLGTGEAGLWRGFLPRAKGTLLVQAMTAAALYTALAGFHYAPSLRPDDHSQLPPDGAASNADPEVIGTEEPGDIGPVNAEPVNAGSVNEATVDRAVVDEAVVDEAVVDGVVSVSSDWPAQQARPAALAPHVPDAGEQPPDAGGFARP